MTIVILGAGHMGGWLVRLLRSDHVVYVYEPDETAARDLAHDRMLADAQAIARINPDMLLNAVSLERTIETFRSVESYLSPSCLLCDVASVKGDLPEYYDGGGRPFVSVHPMFGPTFARMEDLKGENAVIISESDHRGKVFWNDLFGRLGVSVFEYPFSEHDHMMAYSLTLPFVSSLVFSSCVSMKAVPGTTFRKHVEVASGLLGEDDFLLTEILFNRESLEQLQKISGRLSHLRHIIDQRDTEEAKKFIASLRQNMSPQGEA